MWIRFACIGSESRNSYMDPRLTESRKTIATALPGGVRRTRGLLMAIAAHLAFTTAALGQDPVPATLSDIAGRLLDADTGAPISGASVSIDSLGLRTLSDAGGAFRFVEVPTGTYQLEVRHIAYGTRTTQIQVASGGTLSLELRFAPEAIALEPLEVEIEFRPGYLERMGFYDRRAEGIGKFYDPAYIKRWGVGTWGAARNLVGEIILGTGGAVSGGGVMCDGGLQLLIDGRLDRVGLISTMSSSNIGAVEVFDGAYRAPDFLLAAGADPFCLTVIIWTRQWLNEYELERRRIVLCEPGEESGRPALVVEGTVTDDLTGVILPRAAVTAWVTRPSGKRDERTTTADDRGRYRFCELDPEAPVAMWASFAGLGGGLAALTPDGTASFTRDLRIPISRPGRIVGRVVDRKSGKPVSAAEITLRGTLHRAQSDQQGFFEIADVSPGDHALVVAHLGYGGASDSVSVGSGSTTDVRIELSVDPVELAPLIVTAVRNPRLEARGFYDRRDWGERLGQGHFFTREDIERSQPVRVTRLVEEVPGIRVTCRGRGCRVRSSQASGCTQVPVYLDGALVIGSSSFDRDVRGLDELVSPDELAAVEVYTSAASLPGDFPPSSNRCGAIVLWTR